MQKILMTGAKGFIGRNLTARLRLLESAELFLYDIDSDQADLKNWLAQADVVFHLAGVNRPENAEDFQTGNAGFTEQVCNILRQAGRTPKLVMSSSIQAELDNAYGVSKRQAEGSLLTYSQETGALVSIYRLKNVFGKWCRPEYNSVTATFCHHIAHDLPISISDPATEVDLVYIDDVVESLLFELTDSRTARPATRDTVGPKTRACEFKEVVPSYRITLGELAGRIQAFHHMKSSLMTPNLLERFGQCLYATYLSYLEPEAREYGLDTKSDARGNLAEFIKSKYFGQVFVSRTHPGISRGNHYHHTKTEKFFVIAGEGLIRMRHIESSDVVEYRVRGEDYRVIDIPPAYTHSITNVGETEMITLFWASEVFNPDLPDTYYLEVD